MPTVTPFIPQQITVHLGTPDSNAANVTVSFSDYIKNVASSEIYPTWNESALRANIYAIVSFALNRVYTEFYRSRGYDFDITSSTAYDQAFVNGRSFFSQIERLVDELFNDYLRRPGFVEPLAAKFCNGTTVTCEGLSQWGSQNLALQGYDTDQILRSYYGNIETEPEARKQVLEEILTTLQNNPEDILKMLRENIEELKEISPVFEEDVYGEISLETCVEKRLTHGAPSAQIMRRQVEDNENYLNEGDWK